MKKQQIRQKTIADTVHAEAKRVGIPTEEFADMESDAKPIPLRYPRNPDLDPQLVWKGKDAQDAEDLTVKAMPIYIQEKIHPRTIIEDLVAETTGRARTPDAPRQLDFFSDFNGVPKGVNKMDFYHYEQNWTNRMILGDSLQVMASLAEKENLRGKVQCIYFDPPYGIKFNSNFQWSTTSTNVKDGKDMTQEPEMVKAFRDTWRYGIHSYLSYIRDRLVLARDLLSDSGSIFVQIGDENVHRVRAVLDEVFGAENWVSVITFKKSSGSDQAVLDNVCDYILWYARDKSVVKNNKLLAKKPLDFDELGHYTKVMDENYVSHNVSDFDPSKYNSPSDIGRVYSVAETTSSGNGGNTVFPLTFQGQKYIPPTGRHWSTHAMGMERLEKANRLTSLKTTVRYLRYYDDFAAMQMDNCWTDIGGIQSRKDPKVYVVQTATEAIKRCILMTTDPGDLVLDPTCGSGTTAYVAEQWGRRWITIDTSRVALALARARLMGARYPYYILADSPEGQKKEGELSQKLPSTQPTYGNIRQGFVYERVPHITLKSIANNAEIDVIWEKYAAESERLRKIMGGVR